MFQSHQFDETIQRCGGRTYTTPLFDNTLEFWMRERVVHLVKTLATFADDEGLEGWIEEDGSNEIRKLRV